MPSNPGPPWKLISYFSAIDIQNLEYVPFMPRIVQCAGEWLAIKSSLNP
jgi:hypothetical protein